MSSIRATSAAPQASSSGAVGGPDVERERMLTAGATRGAHFNAAGSALPSSATVASVVEHLRREQQIGGYEAAAAVRDRVDAVYDSAARLVGARPREIALFDSATTALRVIIDALRLRLPRRIVVASTTYVSHALHLMSIARERGLELIVLPTTPDRRVDLAALEALLADGVPSLVSVAHIPTSSGLVEPVERIGAIVRRHGGTYVLDATQSVGHLPIDVDALGCDVLVTTGRKFLRAPRGTGFAYVRGSLLDDLEPVAPDVRGAHWVSARDWTLVDSARRFESWEASIAARLGMGTALDEAIARGTDATGAWLRETGASIRGAVAEIPGVRVADPLGADSAIVTFTVDGMDPQHVVAGLAERAVSVTTVPATHGQWDLGARGIDCVVRASAHVYNNGDDISALIDGLRDLTDGGTGVSA